ncbi:hypothetical protein K458DRAFT_392232 [Lentithecium fluviatile CBS 122367]|uniref:Transcription factor domain-containing protein n=1 Tax=Lentithecium fluviatile CBS 122367 TaxID=1168545 RepID=A0A6G1IRX9_9PLEO|nr:hypothetical protein K458DRAFT_392232 [Lentithecium fluviatile CBS 122367]
MPTSFEFIPADSSGRSNAAERTRIRSRCMQGKNKRDGSRRSLREARRGTPKPALSVPQPPPSNVAISLAEDIGRQSRETLFKVFAYKSLEQSMSPLKDCVSFSPIETKCFEWLFNDASFLHALLLVGSMMNDFNLYNIQQPGSKTYKYLRKTILLLNIKLGEQEAHSKDSTLYVVITLTMLAAWSSDWRAASAHIAGLYKIVELRGGLEYLAQRPKLHFKLDRIDLAWALSSGERPYFLPIVVSWDPLFPRDQLPNHVRASMLSMEGNVDERLATVFHDLQFLTYTINTHAQKHTKWEADSFQAILNSIQARLLRLPSTPTDPLSESMRLGMLAFLTTMFAMPGRKIPYPFLAHRFRGLFQKWKNADDRKRRPTVQLWALTVGAVSAVVDVDEDWFLEAWKACSSALETSWEEARLRLLSVMWIECMHDNSGRMAFQQLCTRVHGSEPNLQGSYEGRS